MWLPRYVQAEHSLKTKFSRFSKTFRASSTQAPGQVPAIPKYLNAAGPAGGLTAPAHADTPTNKAVVGASAALIPELGRGPLTSCAQGRRLPAGGNNWSESPRGQQGDPTDIVMGRWFGRFRGGQSEHGTGPRNSAHTHECARVPACVCTSRRLQLSACSRKRKTPGGLLQETGPS